MFSDFRQCTTSMFRERRLLYFAQGKEEIPIPGSFEYRCGRVERLRLERSDLHNQFQRSVEKLPEQPSIAPNVLRSFPNDEAERIFASLEKEGTNAGDVLLLRTLRSQEKEYLRCKQETYEEMLLLNALRDVQKMQTLLQNYIQEQISRENRGDDQNQCKRNRAKAYQLLEIITDIGNWNCKFPEREKEMTKEEMERETQQEKEKREQESKKLTSARKDFRYHCIRDLDELRDEAGNPLLSMQFMRSLAFLHQEFNALDVDKTMNVHSIMLAEHSGEELLTLARNELDPFQSKPLQDLSKELRSMEEPNPEDFHQYFVMIENLPTVPRLILTLLHRDIASARPHVSDEYYGRKDLVEQYNKGGDIVTDAERAILMRELIEYLADYSEAIEEGDTNENERDLFTVRNAYRVYQLLRENARKYLFQSGVNFIYLTGSDHGVKHLIQGDIRFCAKIAEELKWSARDRVCLRQIAVNHDLGYTHHALQRFSMHKEGIPLDNGYYELTKDHPLYSSVYFEMHRLEYEEYFGKRGTRIISQSILDHSEVKGNLRDPDPAKRVQALFCRIDCMAVSADLKAAPAFMDDKVLVGMSKAFEAAEYLRVINARMEELWKAGNVRSEENKWLAMIRESLRATAGDVKRYLLGLSKEIYKEPAFQQAYHRAMDEHYDPFNPTFPVQRDFGSNAIEFASIDVRSTSERDTLTARFGIKPLLFFISDYFGKEQGADFATSAIKKVLEDFGGAVHNPTELIRALDRLSSIREKPHSIEELEEITDGDVVYAQQHETHVRFEFEMPTRGTPTPLIERMIKLIPYQEMMRELMRPDFNVKRIRPILIRIADDTKNDAMTASIEKGKLKKAMKLFLDIHFALPE